MLVIISDLHLTDGSSGQTIQEGAFRIFRERFRDLVYDASKRTGDRYEPLKEVDLILLGDILDIIRSDRWCHADPSVRPWGTSETRKSSRLCPTSPMRSCGRTAIPFAICEVLQTRK